MQSNDKVMIDVEMVEPSTGPWFLMTLGPSLFKCAVDLPHRSCTLRICFAAQRPCRKHMVSALALAPTSYPPFPLLQHSSVERYPRLNLEYKS
jgi:hypothetical protein